MPKLINTARGEALFTDTRLYDISSVEVDIPAIQVDKVADMDEWIGDVLQYTVTIKNLDTTIVAEDVVFTDTINPALAKLVLTSVKVDGTEIAEGSGFTYNATTGALEITAIDDIPVAPGQSVITFQVTKA